MVMVQVGENDTFLVQQVIVLDAVAALQRDEQLRNYVVRTIVQLRPGPGPLDEFILS